jgi:hypothetical protein
VPHSSRLYRDGWGGCPLATGPCPVRFDFDAARLAGRPVAEAAPWPVLGLFDEATCDWIAVDVVDLLGEFLLSETVKVVLVRIAVIIALLTHLAVSAFAQVGTSSSTPAPGPLYSAGAFLGFNHYDTPQMKGGGFFDTKIAENTYNESTLNMTSKLATVTTGLKRFFYSSSHCTVGLFATAKAGVVTGDGSATAVFAGGGGIKSSFMNCRQSEGSRFFSIAG